MNERDKERERKKNERERDREQKKTRETYRYVKIKKILNEFIIVRVTRYKFIIVLVPSFNRTRSRRYTSVL